MATQTTINGVSTYTEVGTEKYERFKFRYRQTQANT